MEMMIWNVVLTALVGVMAFMIKAKFEELDRLGILLNKTREEVARDHVTRSEVRSDMERLMERLDAGIQRLENKIDELAKSSRNAQR